MEFQPAWEGGPAGSSDEGIDLVHVEASTSIDGKRVVVGTADGATGKTIDTALRRIERAIEIHLRGMRADGLRLPSPRQRAVKPRRSASRVDFYATVEVAA